MCAPTYLSLTLEVRRQGRKKGGNWREGERRRSSIRASSQLPVHSGVCPGAGAGRGRCGRGEWPGERSSTLDEPSCPRLQDPEPWAAGEVGSAGVGGGQEELRDGDPGVTGDVRGLQAGGEGRVI